ncbi:MAG: phospho-sugar mutase [Clostridiales bacterium]|nr:phospho-sugar mutase [Clostridiales bacterium]
MNALERYHYWLSSPDIADADKAELWDIKDDLNEIVERFYTELSFGTAGLRGILGAGDNRMNVYNVRRATEGLARYLTSLPHEGERAVCIAYDSRRFSDVFARESACVLAAHGISVYLFSTLHSVPQLSFATRYYKCMAGIVITASHNPPKYNGYKVYWSHGGQVAPREADAILDNIRGVEGFATAYMPYQKALRDGLVTLIGREVDEAYFAATLSLLLYPALDREKGPSMPLIYTPLHGTGYVPVTTVLSRMGLTQVFVVDKQRAPDPDFPTVASPNPEDPNAFTLALRLAEEKKADVILATDPDADRLGVNVRKQDGTWVTLTGNQIGSILIYSLLSAYKATGKLPLGGLVVKSLVSTRLADAICARFNVTCKEVLTGFRFISEEIARCEEKGDNTFLFGFEESYGFLAGGFARDKDAICAAMLVAEACIAARARGLTLYDLLQEIYKEFGYFKESVKSYTLEGKTGIERINTAMVALRAAPPAEVAGFAIAKAVDYKNPDETGLPPSNVLRYSLENGAWIAVRPSGTEPKLKLYIGADADSEPAVDALLAQLMDGMDGLLCGYLYE